MGPIFGSHDLTVFYTLGWDDEASPTFKVEGETCDYYVEGGITLECPDAPTSKTSFPLPINPLSHKCQGCPCPCTNIADPDVGATKVEEEWVGVKTMQIRLAQPNKG